MILAASVLATSSVAMADFVVNNNLGTLSLGNVALSASTVGGPNNATTYTGANLTSYWGEEYVYQFTLTSPQEISLTTNDPNAGPTGPDNDFFLTNTLATPGGVGQAIPSLAGGGFSGVEVSGGWGVQPAGTYYLIADAWRAAAANPSTATAFTGTLTIGTPVVTPPTSTPTTLSGSLTGSLGAGGVTWYSFTTTGGPVSFDTEGSNLGPSNDTELFLYSSSGALLGTDDDDGTGLLSILNSGDELPASLPAGTYYLAIGGFNTTASAAPFGVTSTSSNTGNYVINGLSVVVPEPTSLALIGLTGLVARRRR